MKHELLKEIAGLKETLSKATDIERQLSKRAYALLQTIHNSPSAMAKLDRDDAKVCEYLASLIAAATLEQCIQDLARYEVTMGLELMQIKTRYVLTDTPNLICPAGIDPETRIFIKTRVSVCLDAPVGLSGGRAERYFLHDLGKL